MFPEKHGISLQFSPTTLVTEKAIYYDKHCKCELREYAQACHDRIKENNAIERTINAIYLRPNVNAQGGRVAVDLTTGEIISRNKATAMPLSEIVKNRVKQMA